MVVIGAGISMRQSSDGDQDTFYVFAYDWRRDNVESARLLAQKIAAFKQKLGKPDLRFDIIAHSMGGLVARYYAMYGDRDVLDSVWPKPDWAGARNLGKLIMRNAKRRFDGCVSVFTSGYSITETSHPHIALLSPLNRDSISTYPSAYELLPRNAGAHFWMSSWHQSISICSY